MTEYNKKVFAANLTRIMEATGTRQVDIAALLHVSKSTVSSWCSGLKVPRMDKIETLANHFGILKSELIEQPPADPGEGLHSGVLNEWIDVLKDLDTQDQKTLLNMVKAYKAEKK